MQIECREGLASGSAGTVEWSTVDHSARSERGFCEQMWQGEPRSKREEQICSAIRRTRTDRREARRILLMERVVSCGSGDQWSLLGAPRKWGKKKEKNSCLTSTQ